jgi:hypothetical protein
VSSYYVDGQVAKQTQGGQTISYKLDPEGRTWQTIYEGTKQGTYETYYDGPGSAPAGTAKAYGGEVWTRNIPGIDGALAGVASSAGPPVLQLHDLQGNIVATAAVSETETKLLSKYNSTEFGVPTTKEPPPKYAWLGADGLASELPSGSITQDGVTYVPQTGRQLQTQPVNVPDPINAGSTFVAQEPAWATAEIGQAAARQVALYWEAKGAEEAANQPPGVTPTPEGGIEVVEGAAGSGASIARRITGGRPVSGCSAVFQIKATGNEGLLFGALLLCEQKKPHLELKACLYEKYQDGPWKQAWCANGGKAIVGEDAHGLQTGEIAGGCTDGFLYTGWVWGFVWGSGTKSQAFGGLSPSETGAYVNCSGQNYDHEL